MERTKFNLTTNYKNNYEHEAFNFDGIHFTSEKYALVDWCAEGYRVHETVGYDDGVEVFFYDPINIRIYGNSVNSYVLTSVYRIYFNHETIDIRTENDEDVDFATWQVSDIFRQ